MSRRAGRYVQKKARDQRERDFRANWKSIVVVCSACITTFVALVVATGFWVNRESAFFSAGASAGAIAFIVWFSTHSAATRRLFNGAEAERFTAGVLRRLRRQGWRSVDDLEFASGNVDHVFAGPGGVFAVETKWTTWSWQITDGEFEDRYARKAVRQCRTNGRLIGSLLRGQHGIECELTPLLVIWGPGRPTIDAPVKVGGVLVVPGPLLRRTLSACAEVLEASAGQAAIEALDEFTRTRVRRAATRPTFAKRELPPQKRRSTRFGELGLQPLG